LALEQDLGYISLALPFYDFRVDPFTNTLHTLSRRTLTIRCHQLNKCPASHDEALKFTC